MFYQLRAAELEAAVDEQRRAAYKEQVALAARGGPNGDDAQLGALRPVEAVDPLEKAYVTLTSPARIAW